MSHKFPRREFLRSACRGAAALSVASAGGILASCSRGRTRLPNFVVVFIDDLGYGDLGCYGARGDPTPVVDGLAAEGVRFTDFYVPQAVCGASRAGLLTGCYPNRIGLLGAPGPNATHGIHERETTIAEMLRPLGYTSAIFGKWHLGQLPPFLPLRHGFDEYYGLPYSNDMWPVDYNGVPHTPDHWKSKHPVLPLIEGGEKVGEVRTLEDQDQLTAAYTRRAVQFIDRNAERPFFLYLAHTMVHTPLGVSDRFKGKSGRGKYGDTLLEIDWSVGEVLAALDRHRLAEDTLVVFTSDNGPWINFGAHAGSPGPFREAKGTAWEGGVRVPCVMRWPGVIKAGRVSRELVSTLEILPTFAELSGAALPKLKIDGIGVAALLRGRRHARGRADLLYYYDKQLCAVRRGRWKLVFPHEYRSYLGVEPGTDGMPGPYAKKRCGLELYDLEADPGETTDLAAAHPDVVSELQALGERAREELGDVGREGSGLRPSARIESPS